MWYADKATTRAQVIANNRTKYFLRIQHIQQMGLTLQNTARRITQFLSANNYRQTIPDLTLTGGHASTMTRGCSYNTDGSGDSDPALITTTLAIKKVEFMPRRVYTLTDWTKFDKPIADITIAPGAWENGESTLAMAAKVNQQLQNTIEAAVLWSKAGTRSKRWWNKDVTKLTHQMANDK